METRFQPPFHGVRVGSIHEVEDVQFVYGPYLQPSATPVASEAALPADLVVGVTLMVMHDAVEQNGRFSVKDVVGQLRLGHWVYLARLLDDANRFCGSVATRMLCLAPLDQGWVAGAAMNMVSSFSNAVQRTYARHETSPATSTPALRVVS